MTTVTPTQVYRVYIKATPESIWEAITKPDWTIRYGYANHADFDLRPGGRYQARASEEFLAAGAPEIVVDGEVLEADPPRKLVQTWRMLMDPTLKEEGFTRLTYEIDDAMNQPGVCRLTVTHELEEAPGLLALLRGDLEDTGAGGGWNWVLSDLKSVLETGKGFAA